MLKKEKYVGHPSRVYHLKYFPDFALLIFVALLQILYDSDTFIFIYDFLKVC